MSVILESNVEFTAREWLKKLRKEAGYTQAKLAKRVGISRSTYSMYEQGRRDPSIHVAIKIASLLKFSWTDFFESKIYNMCQVDLGGATL